MDDVTGIGSPDTPDATPALKQSGMSPAQAALWNAGQRRAVVGAQAAAVEKHNAFTWQNLQPMSATGGVGMVSPDAASCLNGGPDMHTGKGFPGLRRLCSAGGRGVRDMPLFQTIWADRNEMGGALGHGSCTEKADCARDTCSRHSTRVAGWTARPSRMCASASPPSSSSAATSRGWATRGRAARAATTAARTTSSPAGRTPARKTTACAAAATPMGRAGSPRRTGTRLAR